MSKSIFDSRNEDSVPVTSEVTLYGDEHEKDLVRTIKDEHNCTREEAIDHIHRAEERGDIRREDDMLYAQEPGLTAGEIAAGPITYTLRFFFTFVRNFFSAILGVLPMGHGFWRRMFQMSLFKLYKASSADAINLVARDNGYIDPVPVKYGADEEDKEAWMSKDGEEKWHPSINGYDVLQMGSGKFRTPVVISGDEPETTNPLEAHLAEALEWEDRHRPILKEPTIQENFVQVVEDPAELEGAENGAVADGGTNKWQRQGVDVVDWGREHDVLVDSGVPEGFNGQAWSLRNYAELTLQRATTQDMERQYDLGKMSEKDSEADKKFAIKVMLIALGVVGLVVAGFWLLTSGVGGGGSVTNLSIGGFW